MLVFTMPSWYKSHNNPEASIFVYEQMQALKELGDKVVVLAVDPVSIKAFRKANKKIYKEDDNGIITYRTEINVLYPSKLRKQYIVAFRNALNVLLEKAIQDQGNPEIIYAI